MQTGGAGEEFLHSVTSVSLAIIQQDNQMAGYLTQQVAKEHHDFFAMNIVLIQLAVQGAMKASRADGDAGDG